MESALSSSFRHCKTPSCDRLLGILSQTPSAAAVGTELQENDILWSAADDDRSSKASQRISASPIKSRAAVGFPTPETSGILAALPEQLCSPDRRFIHRKPSLPPPPSSRINIPSIPKPPSPRKHTGHQSAPLDIPLLRAVERPASSPKATDFEDEAEEAEERVLPPHEIAARAWERQSPMTTFSVLEGKGRTLKGRDLRQVRNAVFRQTGFLD